MALQRSGGDTYGAISELIDARMFLEQQQLREKADRMLGPRDDDGGPSVA